MRARILNIPQGSTGFAYGDVVLNDGAPVGSRLDANGVELAVFNVLELFEPAPFTTHEVELIAPTAADMEALSSLSDASKVQLEDWTKSIRYLCRACDEGRAHESHDHEGGQNTEWVAQRRVAFAAREPDSLEQILSTWLTGARRIASREVTLDARTRRT